MKRIAYTLLTFLASIEAWSTKIVSASHADWHQQITWQGQQVPANPDTIFIQHYVTFSKDLVINAPTVLIIGEGATLCGDYLLDVSCGARLVNYGNLYVNRAVLRDAFNHKKFTSKVSATIVACNIPGFGQGFYNITPGVTLVWPPVSCKTEATDWVPTGLADLKTSDSENIFVSHTGRELVVECDGDVELQICDIAGKIISETKSSGAVRVSTVTLSPGLYIVIARNTSFYRRLKFLKE